MFRHFKASILIALALVLVVGAGTVSAAPSESGLVHVVRRGETLSGIAVRYGVNMWALARANGIANPSRIYAGQRLIIPTGGPVWPTVPQGGAVHVVQRGETLSGIAARYGVNMWVLARTNGIANPSRIYTGQRLVIPTGQTASTSADGPVHTVLRGQTLSGIAYHYGVSIWAIANANGIANPNLIYAGQRLVIPAA
jgi:LysM repeat protein